MEEIRAGEAFQIVVGQRFDADTTADALDIYRVLRLTNPSPYMYLLRLDGFDIVGSRPEALVTVKGDTAMTHPIAGSKPRGATPEEDAALEAELLADEKERAEHVMLVDLGRNDLGRVCGPGTVEVVEFMEVRRYSHVMHLESTVVGQLAAVTVRSTRSWPPSRPARSPVPRRSARWRSSTSSSRPGAACTAAWWATSTFGGDLDAAIAIRTAVLKDGTAYVQAGGDIVADSQPASEDQESQNKAAAVVRAIAVAQTFSPAR